MTENEIEILNIYCKRCKDLLAMDAINYTNIRLTLSMNKSENKGLVFNYEGPKKAEIIAAVIILRQFYMEGEHTNFYHVYNILWKSLIASPNIEQSKFDTIILYREQFQNALENSIPVLRINETKICPKKIIDLWFNGNIFHSDIEKVAKFDWLISSPGAHIAEYIFITTVLNLSKTAINLAAFIEREILKKQT
jgi:hypothetical protein